MENVYSDEEFDKLKTKVLKYILYSKRTEKNIRKKFENEDEIILEDVIEYLKEAGYINDSNYIKKAVAEFINLKNLSLKELEYKLRQKGIEKDIIDDYIYNNKETLLEYEINSAKNLIIKKRNTLEDNEIKQYLSNKGYMSETIKIAIEEV